MESLPLTPEERRLAATLHREKARGKALTEAEASLVSRFYAVADAEEAERFAPGIRLREARMARATARHERLLNLLEREKVL
jgi:hypothetical protein